MRERPVNCANLLALAFGVLVLAAMGVAGFGAIPAQGETIQTSIQAP